MELSQKQMRLDHACDLKRIFKARQLPRDTAGSIMHNFKNSSVKQQTSLGIKERFRQEESDV